MAENLSSSSSYSYAGEPLPTAFGILYSWSRSTSFFGLGSWRRSTATAGCWPWTTSVTSKASGGCTRLCRSHLHPFPSPNPQQFPLLLPPRTDHWPPRWSKICTNQVDFWVESSIWSSSSFANIPLDNNINTKLPEFTVIFHCCYSYPKANYIFTWFINRQSHLFKYHL